MTYTHPFLAFSKFRSANALVLVYIQAYWLPLHKQVIQHMHNIEVDPYIAVSVSEIDQMKDTITNLNNEIVFPNKLAKRISN